MSDTVCQNKSSDTYVIVFSPGPQNFAPPPFPFIFPSCMKNSLDIIMLAATGSSQELLGHLNVQVVAFLHLNLGLLREVENLWVFSS